MSSLGIVNCMCMCVRACMVCVCGVMAWRSRVLPCMTRCPCMVVRVVYPPFVSCVWFTLTCEIDTLADSVCPVGKGAEET